MSSDASVHTQMQLARHGMRCWTRATPRSKLFLTCLLWLVDSRTAATPRIARAPLAASTLLLFGPALGRRHWRSKTECHKQACESRRSPHLGKKKARHQVKKKTSL